MTQTQIIQMAFEAWSAVFCLLSAICVIATSRYDRTEARSLLGLLLSDAVLNVAEALAYYYRGNMTTIGFYMTRAANFTVFFCNHLLLLFTLRFLCQVIVKNGGAEAVRPRRFATTLIGVGMALLICSRVFGFYYDFDAQNRYYRLGSYWIMLALTELVMLLIIVITFSNWKYLKPGERIGFTMIEFLPVLAIAFQMFAYGISVTTIANTASIFMLFLTYELEYANYMVGKERRIFNQMISAFAQAIDAKDRYTGGHSERVARYSRMLAERMKLGKEQVEQIYQAAMLHDIGKIGVAGKILRKDDKLSDDEYEEIQIHTKMGGEILSRIKERPLLSAGARWHHEHFDGTGYPDGLRGEDIPIEARIISVADSYDAMTSNRSYRRYLPQAVVRAEIEKNSGTQFDPRVARCMLAIIDEDKEYTLHE